MPLPTLETVKALLASNDRTLRERVLTVARRLEALNEYGSEQALLVAFDIVRTRLDSSLHSKSVSVIQSFPHLNVQKLGR